MKTTNWICLCLLLAGLSVGWEARAGGSNAVCRLVLELTDGSRVVGTPQIATLPLQTDFAKVDVPLERVRSVKFAADHATASVTLANGDRLQGRLALAPLALAGSAVAEPLPADWSQWQSNREQVAVAGLTSTATVAQRCRGLVENEGTAVALAQATFVRRVGAATLTTFAQTPGQAAFLEWLMARRAALEEFCATIQPNEDAGKVLGLWAQLWNVDAKGREAFWRLALACALVFDEPVTITPELAYGTVDMAERYNYFRQCAEVSALCAPVAEMAAYELVWVVDAPVPNSELDWARRNVKYARSQWSQAYAAVAYRMDRALRGAEPYKTYSLAEIKAKGGICGDQAYFATITAKANGIPAMAITGQGQRGGHAWFAYKASAQEWNMKAGRYPDDEYATGYTTDPQTRQTVKEQALLLLADNQRRQPVYGQATRLVWLADLLAPQPASAIAALEVAVQACPRHLPAWTALFGRYRQAKVPLARLAPQFAAARSAFRQYPDALSTVDRWEVEQLRATGDDAAAAELLRQQQRRIVTRGDGDRTDLLLEAVTERAKLLEERRDVAGADKVYRDALREQSRNLVMFCAIADRYFAFGERANRRHEVVRSIQNDMGRIAVPFDDPFAMRAYAQVERQVAGYLDRDGQGARAKALRQQATQREAQALSIVP
jgi:hypothetical protein